MVSYYWLMYFLLDHCDSTSCCSFWPLCLVSAGVFLGLCLSNKGGCERDWMSPFNIFSWPHASTQNPSFFQILSGVRGQTQELSPWPRIPPQTSSSVGCHWIRIQEGKWGGGQLEHQLSYLGVIFYVEMHKRLVAPPNSIF